MGASFWIAALHKLIGDIGGLFLFPFPGLRRFAHADDARLYRARRRWRAASRTAGPPAAPERFVAPRMTPRSISCASGWRKTWRTSASGISSSLRGRLLTLLRRREELRRPHWRCTVPARAGPSFRECRLVSSFALIASRASGLARSWSSTSSGMRGSSGPMALPFALRFC